MKLPIATVLALLMSGIFIGSCEDSVTDPNNPNNYPTSVSLSSTRDVTYYADSTVTYATVEALYYLTDTVVPAKSVYFNGHVIPKVGADSAAYRLSVVNPDSVITNNTYQVWKIVGNGDMPSLTDSVTSAGQALLLGIHTGDTLSLSKGFELKWVAGIADARFDCAIFGLQGPSIVQLSPLGPSDGSYISSEMLTKAGFTIGKALIIFDRDDYKYALTPDHKQYYMLNSSSASYFVYIGK